MEDLFLNPPEQQTIRLGAGEVKLPILYQEASAISSGSHALSTDDVIWAPTMR
jgi:hypothetical protein